MADGFLNRWSRRKSGLESEGQEYEPKSKAVVPVTQKNQISSEETKTPELELPPPTLEDVEKIDRFAPDFSVFMKPNVDPVVQQAAMKKLFSDPHFNIMDRLDIYIDDYSVADPIPMEMLKRMVQSQSLGLFKKREEEDSATGVESTNAPASELEPTHSKMELDTARQDEIREIEQDDAISSDRSLASSDDSSKKKIE